MAKDKTIKIGKRIVGPGHPVYVIAEAGVNHNGSFQTAVKLAKTAKECGADAVKFQTFVTEKLVSRRAEKAPYQKDAIGDDSQFDMLKHLELAFREFDRLKAYCDGIGIEFLSTPFDEESLAFLLKLGVKAVKIGSGDLTNQPLLRLAARSGRPLLISTGMAELDEISAALKHAGPCRGGVCLLHCVSLYPAPVGEMNIRAMATLAEKFRLPVGLSDHTIGMTATLGAVALGASVIERHFTLDKGMRGPDHKASLEPDELAELIRRIREMERALGTGVKSPGKGEMDMRKFARKSVVAARDIRRHAVISREDLALKRPGTGLPPEFLEEIVGKVAKRYIVADEMLKSSDVKM